MRAKLLLVGSAAVLGSLVLSADGVQAQANPVHTHIGHVLTSFAQTPDEEGLLPTAQAEAQVAVQHAGFAAGNTENLDAMKLHTTHVLHAVDPSQIEAGPGRGFGVKRAAQGIVQHIGLAAAADGASANVNTHAPHVSAAAGTVAARADEIVALAERIAAASTAAEAAPLIQELQVLAGQLVAGSDANADGSISWQEGEGGLEHVEQHMGFMAAGEGLD